jgi:site-specific DNA recombinase
MTYDDNSRNSERSGPAQGHSSISKTSPSSSLTEAPTAPKRVAIYVRVSTREQAEHGYSLQAQVDELRRYCDKNNFRVVRVYKDGGHSGSTLDRPMLQRMLDHIMEREFETVLLWKFDRLSRKTRDFLELIEYFKMNGVGLISMTEQLDASTSHGMCMLTVSISIAQFERENISARCILGQMARAREGKWRGGTTPYGYRYNKESGLLEIFEEEAAIIRRIYDEYIHYRSLSRVRDRMNETSVYKRGLRWHSQQVLRILTRQIYCGVYQYKDIVRTIAQYAIIDEKLFRKVQKIMKEHQRVLWKEKKGAEEE